MNFQKSTFIIALILLSFSCEKKSNSLSIDDPVPFPDENCIYKFESNLAPIYGFWEPKTIIDLEDNDTTHYEPGDGWNGFSLLSQHYFDSYEFRPDSTVSFYYARSGPHCSSRVNGIWYHSDDTIYLTKSYNGTLVKIPVLDLNESELVIEDSINFKSSIAIFRKNN